MAFDRKDGIGGSDVAAIMGLSPYRAPFDVWMEKTGDPAYTPLEDTPQMRLGRLMEPVLAKVYEEDHPGLRVVLHGGAHSDPIWHDNHVCYAHIDGRIVPATPERAGEGGIWEGKTAWDDRDWPVIEGKRTIPIYYETQIRHYLAVTGDPWCDVTVFFRRSAMFDHVRIEADPETDSGLIILAERWWDEHITKGNPPAIDGSAGAREFLLHRFPKQTTEEVLRADERIDIIAHSLHAVRVAMEKHEQDKATLENAIMEAMGEYGKIEGDGWSATWRRSKGRTMVGWQEVASAYRGLLHQIELALRTREDIGEALRLLTDNPPDAIVGLYTRTGDGTRPFVFRASGKGEQS